MKERRREKGDRCLGLIELKGVFQGSEGGGFKVFTADKLLILSLLFRLFTPSLPHLVPSFPCSSYYLFFFSVAFVQSVQRAWQNKVSPYFAGVPRLYKLLSVVFFFA